MRIDRLAVIIIGISLFFLAIYKPLQPQSGSDFLISFLEYRRVIAQYATIYFLPDYSLSWFDISTLLLVYFGLLYYGFSGKLYFRKEELWIFLSLFFIIFSALISLMFAKKFQPEQIVSIARYFQSFLVIYFLIYLFTDSKNRKLFLIILLAGTVIETLASLFIFMKTQTKGILFSTANVYFQVFWLTTCVIFYLYSRHRIFMIGAIFSLLPAVFATINRSALIFLLNILVFAGLFSLKSKFRPYLFFLLVFILGIFLVNIIWQPIFTAVVERIEQGLELGSSVSYRLYFWDRALGSFLENPITGIGIGGFPRQLYELPQAFGFNFELDPEYIGEGFDIHNAFLDFLSEMGLIGFLSYLCWFISVAVVCLNTLRVAGEKKDLLIISVSLFIVTFLFHDFYGRASFTPIMNVFLGFLLGWRRQTIGEKSEILEKEILK